MKMNSFKETSFI